MFGKKLTIISAIALLFFVINAQAQELEGGYLTENSFSGSGTPEGKDTTSPFFMSFIFHRIAGKAPDFRELAMNSKEYKETPDNERVYIIDDKIQEYKNTYDLITTQDPLRYEVPVILSKYSEKLKGFFIQNFDEHLYLPFSFSGKNYAIIPEGASDNQWIKVEDEILAQKITKASARSKLKMSKMTMVLSLEPIYADASNPSDINGKSYLLMSAKIKAMDLYSSEYTRPLWSSSADNNTYDSVKLQEILKSK